MSSSDKPTCSRFVTSKSINDKIIEYYLKYAKDRDIEKFMRFSSSDRSKSNSSDDNDYIIEIQRLDEYSEDNQLPQDAKKEQLLTETKTPMKDIGSQMPAPESIAKNDKRLEWDSLGDVGYKKASSMGNISSLERSVLKELFSESQPNISHQPRSEEITSSSNYSLNAKARRERWRQTLDKLGKKYSSLSASLDTQEFVDQPQSTPKPLPNTEKSCQTTFDKKKPHVESSSPLKDHSCQTSFNNKAHRHSKNFEKYCQTSVAKLDSKAIQANLSSRTPSFATQSSFEYHAGEIQSPKSTARRSILSEKNSNTSKSRPSSDSDKENQFVRKTNRPRNDVDLGIKLLCSLIDAKNLSVTQKKHLSKKIFEKIMKQSSTSTSTSLTSTSSAFSVRSLTDVSPPCEDETNRSGNVLVTANKNIQQMSAEAHTEEPKVVENPPTTPSSTEEPVTMREWLNPLTRSEKDYDKKLKKKANQAISPQVSERQRQLSWIEVEINRLEGLKNLLIKESPPKSRPSSSKSTIESNGRAEVIYEETAEDVINLVDQYKRTTRRTCQNVVIYDEPSADDNKQPEKVEYKTTRVIINEEQCSTSSSSPKNHRSKLETPTSSPNLEDETVSGFAHQLQKQFMDNYLKKERRCVSEHYSEPRICSKPIFTRNPSYTSVASSAFCMSSEMSIPIVESSSTSTTTTHQYDSNGCDSIEGVAVQTTYSVIKTDPIFGPRCRCICTCGKECKCSCPRPTVRVSGKAFHQTVQVKPKPLAYVIRFSEKCNSDDKVTDDCLTLQQRLEMQNPNFCIKANERREILKKLHKLRQEREQRIREIAENSNICSISRKLKQLPPPPIKQVRICPTREMKYMTKKRYCKLPEVVQKQEREKLERRRRTTRIITNIFNKKLQRMVHKGKLSLEYSRTVI